MCSDGGSSGEATGSEGADGLLAAGSVGGCGTGGFLVFFDGEEGFAAHGAGRGGGLLEPFGDAGLAEDVVARFQLDWRVHVGHADGACIGGVWHWYQTSGKELGASGKRHDRFAWAVGVRVGSFGGFPCVLACKNDSVWFLLEVYSRSVSLMYLQLDNVSFVGCMSL